MLDACRDSADKSGKGGGIDGSTIRELSDKLALFFAAKSVVDPMIETARAWYLYALLAGRSARQSG